MYIKLTIDHFRSDQNSENKQIEDVRECGGAGDALDRGMRGPL